MTDITLEQRAQLAYETWRDTPADGDSAWPKWLAVAEALRLSAGADSLPDEWREFANKTSVKAGPATAYRHCADMLERRLGGAK